MRSLAPATFGVLLRAALPILTSAAAAQNPVLAEVGEPLPDGLGMIYATGDHDGDGDLDLLTSTGAFFSDGGFFRAGPTMPASVGARQDTRALAVADFNGDGRADFVIGRTSGTPTGLVLFLAPATGPQFTASAGAFTNTGDLVELAAADFDNDGDVDLIAASDDPSSPRWELLLNNGTGVFTAASAPQWPAQPIAASWLGVGDFNNDGRPDVVAGGPTGLLWRRNFGGGFFSLNNTSATSFTPTTGAIGDFNGDGFDDVTAVTASGSAARLAGSATGLATPTFATTGAAGSEPITGDLDGDGFDDIVQMQVAFPASVTGELVVQRGSVTGLTAPAPLGSMRLPNTTSAPFGSTMAYAAVAMLDADADGDLDLAVAPGGSRPWLRLTHGGGGSALATTALPFAAERLHAAPRDIDGDGDVDLLSATTDFGSITMWLHRNDGRGRFGPRVFAGSYPGSALIGGVWADFDNNGTQDLWIPALLFSQPSTVLLNDGTGMLTPGTTIAAPGSAADLAVADFTGDGFQDIVFARNLAPGPGVTFQRPVLLRGIPTPGGVAFAPAVPFGVAELITDLAVFDADRDGDLDLLCGTQVNNNPNGPARVYENDGSGNFTPRPSIPGTQAQTVAVGDLNRDGWPDLVVGDQTWTSRGPNLFFQGTHVQPDGLISLADLDEDGALDLYDNAGQWYRGDGVGGFGAPQPIVGYELGTLLYISSPRAPVDLDSDGDLDVIGPRTFLPGHLAIYSNLTRHATNESLAVAGQPLALAVHGHAGDPWLLATSLPTSSPTVFAPFGTLFLDPGSAVVVAVGNVPASGKSQLNVPIPNAGAGVRLSWQAAVGTPLRFTNGFDTPVGR